MNARESRTPANKAGGKKPSQQKADALPGDGKARVDQDQGRLAGVDLRPAGEPLHAEAIHIRLKGIIPPKKSKYRLGIDRRTGRARMFHSEHVKAQIDWLILQAKQQWKHLPTRHPDMSFQFYLRSRRKDIDSLKTTLLDVFQKAGILVNDNVRHNNGRVETLPAIISEEEGALVVITRKL